MSTTRLVAVLGYSTGSGRELHPVCAARLSRAAEEATPDDAVLLSGWARGRRTAAEAELMARAWNGRTRRLLLDRGARSTYGNARAIARAAREIGATEVVVVTSGWHGRRAARLVRAALHERESRVTLVATDERGSLGHRARELLCWTLVPAQATLAARRR
jgi:uncharacterized SAM-binding protein YcdF (DUF218 family)